MFKLDNQYWSNLQTAITNKTLPMIGEESIMCDKAHGQCAQPAMRNLKWNCDWETADDNCCYWREFCEPKFYGFARHRTWVKTV